MYARLWWKDARQFWPIWVALILGAAITQWLTLSYYGREARYGGLGISAMIWAGLYALAVGAAAFAGERETGTLRLLDILPADRYVVWVSKVSFALVTSLALALLLMFMANWSTDSWNPRNRLTGWQAIFFGKFIVVALGWGLFWSSILKSALTAAVAAICCTGLSLVMLLVTDLGPRGPSDINAPVGIVEMLVIGVSVAGSGAFFTGGARLRRINLEFRSPIVVTRAQSTSRRPLRTEPPLPGAPASSARPIAVAMTPESSGATASTRSSWIIEARTLTRQTIKHGRTIWILLAGIVLVPPLLAILFETYIDASIPGLAGVLVALVAGASALGLDTRARTERFLVHHAARPRLVWLVKMSVWVLGAAVIGILFAGGASMTTIAGPPTDSYLTQYLLMLLVVFGVATICGMAFRRGITALVLGLVLAWALVMPLLMMISMKLLPTPGPVFVAIALLAVSWAWSRDWILDRPAPGRWLRLGIFLTGAIAVLSAGYIGFRVWSVPDMGPIARPAAWNNASAGLISSDRNAADLYREASSRLFGGAAAPDFLGRNKESLDLIRRAAAQTDCWFEQPDQQTLFEHTDVPMVAPLAELVSLEAQQRMSQGDLAGSWDDIMVLFHMARHFSEGLGGGPAIRALTSVERDALGLAMEWAVARGQTPERLHAALAAYREMPKPPSATEVLRAEANIVENTFDLPASKFLDGVEAMRRSGADTPLQSAFPSWSLAPWERARGRRVNRLFFADAIRLASIEPGQRPEPAKSGSSDSQVDYAWDTTPALMKGLFWNWQPFVSAEDRNEVARRALVQILAIRAWQLKHGGQFPERLEALVPEELASLPKDPYSDHSFRLVADEGLRPPPLRSAAFVESNKLAIESGQAKPPAGSRFLLSVGHDRTPANVIIIFAIPPVEGSPGSAKDKGDSAAKDKPGPAAPE